MTEKEKERLCTNCVHFDVCKIFKLMTHGLAQEFPPDKMPVDVNAIATICNFYIDGKMVKAMTKSKELFTP